MKNSSTAINDYFLPPSPEHTYLYLHLRVASLLYIPRMIPAPTAAWVSSLCLHCTLTTGTALFPFSGQTAHLQRQREGKGQEKGKKEKRREIDGNERKRKKETDCFHNVDCQELHSLQSQCALSENRRVKLILFHIPSVLLLPFLFICLHFQITSLSSVHLNHNLCKILLKHYTAYPIAFQAQTKHLKFTIRCRKTKLLSFVKVWELDRCYMLLP